MRPPAALDPALIEVLERAPELGRFAVVLSTLLQRHPHPQTLDRAAALVLVSRLLLDDGGEKWLAAVRKELRVSSWAEDYRAWLLARLADRLYESDPDVAPDSWLRPSR